MLPYDEHDVDGALQALHDRHFIRRYVVDGVPYIQILAFHKHQNPHVREADSIIPGPPRAVPSTVLNTTQGSDEAPGSAPTQAMSSPAVPITVPITVPDPDPVPVAVPDPVPVPRSGDGKKSSDAEAAPPAHPVENPDDNVGVITKLAHTVLDVLGMQTSLVDLTEGVKERCAAERITYTSAVVAKAIDSALIQRKRKP